MSIGNYNIYKNYDIFQNMYQFFRYYDIFQNLHQFLRDYDLLHSAYLSDLIYFLSKGKFYDWKSRYNPQVNGSLRKDIDADFYEGFNSKDSNI